MARKRMAIDGEELARRRPDLALELGLEGLGSDLMDPAAARRLCEAGILEAVGRGESPKAAEEAFARLCELGADWDARLEGWARKSASKLLPKLSERGLEEAERAFPGIVSQAKAPTLAKAPMAARWVGERGGMMMEKALGMILDLARRGDEGAREAACEEAGRAIPEECARAWEIALRDSPLGIAEIRTALLGMGEGMAERVGERLAERTREGGESELSLASGLGRLHDRAGARAEERAAGLFRAWARGLAKDQVGADWAAFGRGESVACGDGGGGKVLWKAWCETGNLGGLPVEWLGGSRSSERGFGARMALAWWRGWREGGGPPPRIWLRAGLGPAELAGPEAFAALLRDGEQGEEAARFLLLESGWASEEGAARALETAKRMDAQGWRLDPSRAALLEAARISLGAGPARGAGAKRGI